MTNIIKQALEPVFQHEAHRILARQLRGKGFRKAARSVEQNGEREVVRGLNKFLEQFLPDRKGKR